MIVLGLTGSFGSGCTYVAEEFIMPKGYQYLSLAHILREFFKEQNGQECDLSRHEMQNYGTQIRQKHGTDFLALKAIKAISESGHTKWIIDSIRNPNEVKSLRGEFSKFYLVALRAESDIRWNRIKKKYDGNLGVFESDDKTDSNEKVPHGQRVRDCYEMADFIISNDKNTPNRSKLYNVLDQNICEFIDIVEGEKEFSPRQNEALMAMAYAASIRSRCLQRKVGAVLVDSQGSIFSSGYNEVPVEQETCKAAFGRCYRKVLKEEFAIETGKVINNDQMTKDVFNVFQNKFKILDYCRSLHAEENAILNVARFGSAVALKGSTLYTTTYPCNLCANKIVQTGIKKIVYMEPYPMKEAKDILNENDIIQEPFEGVSFNGYFRFKEEEG
ncbi:MAG: deaminase [Desulfitobacterium hafniense]|nr:deaminase [Desulfitobacterium hafniense]